MSELVTILNGDCREMLRTLPAESVQTCVTSPPYFGLRDYGCDGQIGLEESPEAFVAQLVDVFREVRRVLRPDGVLWLNLGDSYCTVPHGDGKAANAIGRAVVREPGRANRKPLPGIKHKDLIGIPWMVAKALQQPYYAGRIKSERDRVWLAATLDAEGTICGFKHERPDGNIRTGVLVFVTNGDQVLLDKCAEIWPGAQYLEHNREGDNVNGCIASRDCWRWTINQAEERSQFLAEIYPYLLVKKQQALVAWNLLEFAKAAKRLGRGGESEETKARRIVLTEVLSALNQRQSPVLPTWLKEPPSLHEQGYYLRSDVIWSKCNPMPESVTDRPTKSHEYVFLLSKSDRYFYDADAIKEPASCPEGPGNVRPAKGVGVSEKFRTRSGLHHIGAREMRNKRTVWEIPTQPFPEAHFATYPEELARLCILAGSREGDLVLDPFGGSGTTAAVAVRHGRRAVICELNPEYVQIARRRIGRESSLFTGHLFAEGLA